MNLLEPGWHMKGERNPRYNGGNSEYPDHARMKKNRKLKLETTPNCEDCGKEAVHVHHVDESKNNHAIDNLKSLCIGCHGKYRRGNKHDSKFKRAYGYTLKELTVMSDNKRKKLSLDKINLSCNDILMETNIEAKIKGIMLGRGLKDEQLFPVLKIKSREALRYKFKHEAFKLSELRALAKFLKVPLINLIDG